MTLAAGNPAGLFSCSTDPKRDRPMNIKVEFKVSAPPFRWDESGGIRIDQSRVTLDSLLAEYHSGFTPAKIALQYSVLHNV